jgi:hypothetical protein
MNFNAKIRGSEWLVLVSAIALLVTSFFAWFEIPHFGVALELNLWDLSVARIWVYVAIVLGFSVFLTALLSRTPDWSVILCTPLVIFSFFAMISLLLRVINAPQDDAEATAWFYGAVAASVALFGGACWAIRDERVPSGFLGSPHPELIEVED